MDSRIPAVSREWLGTVSATPTSSFLRRLTASTTESGKKDLLLVDRSRERSDCGERLLRVFGFVGRLLVSELDAADWRGHLARKILNLFPGSHLLLSRKCLRLLAATHIGVIEFRARHGNALDGLERSV
jgi:hypothetical protein